MADRFLAEVRRIHEARRWLAALTPKEREEVLAALGEDQTDGWMFRARDAQLPPEDLGWCWLFVGGRGTGKTRSLSAAIHIAVRSGIRRIHLIAQTTAALHDVNVGGPAGILATAHPDPVPKFIAYKRRVEWPNGATVSLFTAEEPEQLRGPQCEMLIIDEYAAMKRGQEVYDIAFKGTRLGDQPRVLIATTPKPALHMKTLLSRKGLSITTGTTFDNEANLSSSFLQNLRDQYESTGTWRREILGMMILEPESALFRSEWLAHHDISEDMIEQVSVGVDPSGGGDAVGIVVGALLTDGRLAVLADRTIKGTPATWGDAVVQAYDDFDCDDAVVEVNFGGSMATDVVKAAAERAFNQGKRKTALIRVKEVNASRGKVMRAEPVSLQYEKGRVLHRHGLDLLEAEMLQFSRDWDRDTDGSPNRLDAAIWVLTRLSKVLTAIPIA